MNYYDSISDGYDELHKEEQFRKMQIISNELKLEPDDYLLDVGCGSGFSLDFWGCKRIGIDPSKELLKKCESPTKQGVAEDLPFKDNEFDIVTCVSAIHNCSDFSKALDEIKRVGKNKFVITLFKKGDKEKVSEIKKLINDKFEVEKVIEDTHDTIYFCK